MNVFCTLVALFTIFCTHFVFFLHSFALPIALFGTRFARFFGVPNPWKIHLNFESYLITLTS